MLVRKYTYYINFLFAQLYSIPHNGTCCGHGGGRGNDIIMYVISSMQNHY